MLCVGWDLGLDGMGWMVIIGAIKNNDYFSLDMKKLIFEQKNVDTYVEKNGPKRHRQISGDRRHARDTNTDSTYHNTGVRSAFSQNSCVKHNSKDSFNQPT